MQSEQADRESSSGGPAGSNWKGAAKAVFLFFGVIVPTICFAIGFPERPEWQSGELQDYAKLLLDRKPTIPWYPFLLYNMTCMTLLLFGWERFSKRYLVRLGVYTGAILAVHYCLLFAVATASDPSGAVGMLTVQLVAAVSGACVVLPVVWCAYLALRRFGWTFVGVAIGVIALAIAAYMVEDAGGEPRVFSAIVMISFFACLFCATSWAAGAYLLMSLFLIRHRGRESLRFALWQLLAVLTWLGAYCAGWRTSVVLMLQEYAKLPREPPDHCYVCTAAARGHRRLVRSKRHVAPDGRVHRVNDQMRYLKAGELLLAAICPACHRLSRRIYDRIGPPLAACLAHPLLADMAYLALKPPEWTARATLAVMLPKQSDTITRIYGRES